MQSDTCNIIKRETLVQALSWKPGGAFWGGAFWGEKKLPYHEIWRKTIFKPELFKFRILWSHTAASSQFLWHFCDNVLFIYISYVFKAFYLFTFYLYLLLNVFLWKTLECSFIDLEMLLRFSSYVYLSNRKMHSYKMRSIENLVWSVKDVSENT